MNKQGEQNGFAEFSGKKLSSTGLAEIGDDPFHPIRVAQVSSLFGITPTAKSDRGVQRE